jgi:DNA topoisomerase I
VETREIAQGKSPRPRSAHLAGKAPARGGRNGRTVGLNGVQRDEIATDPVAAAERADLVYVNDTDPGIRRKKSGSGFRYLDAAGQPVTDEETLARIRALAIPPAWTDVWICPLPSGHVQATGRDQKGRKQYRYHPEWTACRDEAKFSSLAAFASALPKLRARVEHDLRRRGASRERVIASIVWLLDNTMMRIGNDIYTRQNKSFGLTTLRDRHVAIEGSNLRFSFSGKSGQQWQLKFSDRRVAAVVRTAQELPGQRLFQYLDEEGVRREVRSQDVNDYIREAIGSDFTSKHFRTWGATTAAAYLFATMPLPETKREQTRLTNEVIDRVAARLRNTRTVCRRGYIHPAVIDAWLEGRLGSEMADLRRRFPKPLKGLDIEESTVFRWLNDKDV